MLRRALRSFRPPPGSRSIVTWSHPDLEATATAHEALFPAFRADLALLRASPRTYRFRQHSAGGSYEHAERRVNVSRSTAAFPGRESESLMHETHHAAQHESHVAGFGEDTANSIWDQPAHRTAMEASALATGKGRAAGSEVLSHWLLYPGQPGYSSLRSARHVLRTSKYHAYSRSRLSYFGIDPSNL